MESEKRAVRALCNCQKKVEGRERKMEKMMNSHIGFAGSKRAPGGGDSERKSGGSKECCCRWLLNSEQVSAMRMQAHARSATQAALAAMATLAAGI